MQSSGVETSQYQVSDQKKELMKRLQEVGEAGLDDLASYFKVSKMAIHKHMSTLQDRGLVTQRELRAGVGRPRVIYTLTDEGKSVFPKSYAAIATCALSFIEKKMGREAVESALRERQSEMIAKYRPELGNLDFDHRVKKLAEIRDKEGYMAETRKTAAGKHILLEHNCPLIQVAQKYWEACTTERQMFERLLGAKVETTHRIAGGEMVCRFMIEQRKTA